MRNKINIHELSNTPLKIFSDERGSVMRFLKSNSASFTDFGEAYFSKINHGVVKGWKLHENVSQNFSVPHGVIKVVVYDNREDSPTEGVINEFILNSSDHYTILSIPKGVWYSFKGLTEGYSLLANIINIDHSLAVSHVLPLDNEIVPYKWT